MVQKSGIHQLRLVTSPIIYKVLWIPGGFLAGFQPSTIANLEACDFVGFTTKVNVLPKDVWVGRQFLFLLVHGLHFALQY